MTTPAMNIPAQEGLAARTGAQRESSSKHESSSKRESWPAIRRGMRQVCPACGEGKMFSSYLKVNDSCPKCGQELHHHRADDAPPYMTIFIVGHIVGTAMLITETYWPDAPIWLHAMVWPTLALILSLWFLPIVKGGLIGHQWALRMHGFEDKKSAAPKAPRT
ncbi:DUF983 domain-containing protein [Methylocapsa palsarum]|uniref:Uncharacterized conserved protein, DUF983 family n=1 Tax=Methylocapsa palsarum TaxID=1612308 RepID=A0A1I4AIQ7_9HYPH|nr:Uncharacterized conserved protein, DUF983 family [Methylocapsa palsarum]